VQSKRSDIQAFRALSVALVFMFHAGYGFPNGYLGVDIFFALSGFVIWGLFSRLLVDDLHPLRTFYTGRVRRIMPAATTLIIVVSIVQVSLGITQASLSTVTAGIYSIFSLGNIEIARQVADYFSPEATSSPFLHMWSLGIEEQFYLVLPIAIFWLHRFKSTRKRIPLFVLLISIFSFCIELFATIAGNKSLIFGYYSPLPRVWEFGVGILAYIFLRDLIRKTYQFLLVVFVIFVLMWLPAEGLYLLLIKTTLLALIAALLSSPRELGKSVFSRLLIWLGDRSYSFYLWHWPIILVFRDFSWNPIILLITMFFLIIVLANISYHLIEQPIRRKQVFPQLKRVIAFFLVFPGLILFILYTNMNSQLAFKNSIKSVGIVMGDVGQKDFHQFIYQNFDTCANAVFLDDIPKYVGRPQCAISNANAHPKVILLGDSHSEHLFIGIANELVNHNTQYIDTAGLPVYNSDTNQKIFNYVNDLPSPKVVVLSAFWNNRGVPTSLNSAIRSLKRGGGAAIFLISDSPAFSLNPLDCKFAKKENVESVCFERLPQSTSEIETNMILRKIAKEEDVNYVAIRDLFCSTEHLCSMIQGDKLLFRDNNHLNIYGSNFVGKRLATLITRELSLFEK
jgi:peptidoglycan/LPS O-acetylase OafA/YrhL